MILIEWILLNDIRNPIKNGNFKCKTTLKLHQKQFNTLTSECSRFLIYNNPSFATKLRRSLFGHRIRQTKFCDLRILMVIISQKQTLATFNSLKVVEISVSKIWKLCCVLAPLPNPQMVSQTEYLFCLINPITHFKPIFHLCRSQVDTSSVGWYAHFICHVTPRNYSVEMPCIFISESSSQHVTTLIRLVTIGILIVKRKTASWKTWNLIDTYYHWKTELIG